MVASRWLLLFTLFALPAFAADDAQVVLVVDTSGSMSRPGMDPERTSLLVSRLYADIVPGELSVVRLLDLRADAAALPSRPSGQYGPCQEDPSQRCEGVTEVSPGAWGAAARAARGPDRERFGVLTRAGPSDAPRFKTALDAHLEARINNSLFGLGFRTAQGLFDEARAAGPRRQFLLWLSDGLADDKAEFMAAATEVMRERVVVEALVFGRGDTALAEGLNLTPRRTTSPGAIMSAFADVFRRIVNAPFRADGEVARSPSFVFKPHVTEAWVVVYGDTTLSSAWIEGPSGRVDCDDAEDRVPRAGAYRVAHLHTPVPGTWTVHVEGGGAAAYAVIQRPGLRVAYLGPATAAAGAETPLVAAIESEQDGRRVNEAEILAGIEVSVLVNEQRLPMFDDGTHGDARAADGEFTASYAFPKAGPFPIDVHASSETVDSTAHGSVQVEAGVRYRGGPVIVDLGELRWGERRCAPLFFDAEVSAPTEVAVKERRGLPSQHSLVVRTPTGDVPVGSRFTLTRGLRLELCLVVGDMAPSSTETGEPLLEIGTDGPDGVVPVGARWSVEGRPWWIRYQKEILGFVALLVTAGIVYGWIWPFRFDRRMGLQVSASADLEQGGFYAFSQFRGTGGRWYRHAVAYLHDNYRISGGRLGGAPPGATAEFRARGKGVRLRPVKGHRIEWLDADGEWQPLPDGDQPASVGRVYRVASAGALYFEVRRG